MLLVVWTHIVLMSSGVRSADVSFLRLLIHKRLELELYVVYMGLSDCTVNVLVWNIRGLILDGNQVKSS